MNNKRYDAITISPEKFKKWAKKNNLTLAKISNDIGQTRTYISQCLTNGLIPARKLDLICRLYGATREDFISCAKKAPTTEQNGYSLSLDVKPDKVRVGIFFNGSELYGAWAAIKGETEISLMQSISYAAHMCYKLAEQAQFSGK